GPGPVLHLRTHDPREVLAALAEQHVRTVLLEGGPTLGGAFWSAGFVDELLVYVAPVLLGTGAAGVPDLGVGTLDDAPRLRLVDLARVGPDVRLRLVPGAPPPGPGAELPGSSARVPVPVPTVPVPTVQED